MAIAVEGMYQSIKGMVGSGADTIPVLLGLAGFFINTASWTMAFVSFIAAFGPETETSADGGF